VLRFDGEPPREHAAPPLLGEHDAAVRAWLTAAGAPDAADGGHG
jgi:hypothetical protein